MYIMGKNDYVFRRIVSDFEKSNQKLPDAIQLNERLVLYVDRLHEQRRFLARMCRFGVN